MCNNPAKGLFGLYVYNSPSLSVQGTLEYILTRVPKRLATPRFAPNSLPQCGFAIQIHGRAKGETNSRRLRRGVKSSILPDPPSVVR